MQHLIVETTAGRVAGVRDGAVSRWLGIPYADAPPETHRWRAPQPPTPWSGIRQAKQFGNISPQLPTKLFTLPSYVSQDENCLNLNIWAPVRCRSQRRPRPVMVWIHGGGYIVGSSAQPIFNGQHLAETGDVVVVSLNYRLGALGFLDFTSLPGAGDRFESNVGLKDIIAALQWIRDNIQVFGGDPQNVTLFGQSAGGASVTTLMTLPSTRGLFHRAVAQSPPATSLYLPERSAQIARRYLDLVQIDESDAAQALFERDASTLVAPTMQLLDRVASATPGILAFAPVVDGELVPEHPLDVFVRGEQHPIPLMIGSTHDEAGLFKMMKSPLMPTTGTAVESMFHALQQDMAAASGDANELHPARITAAYPGFPDQRAALHVSGDAGIGMPVTWISEAHARIAPTYTYRFDQATPMLKALGVGAIHASEIPYVFGTLPKKASLSRKDMLWVGGLHTAWQVSERMQERWLSFATDETPDGGDTVHWPQYDTLQRATLIVSHDDSVVSDPYAERREAWGNKVMSFQ